MPNTEKLIKDIRSYRSALPALFNETDVGNLAMADIAFAKEVVLAVGKRQTHAELAGVAAVTPGNLRGFSRKHKKLGERLAWMVQTNEPMSSQEVMQCQALACVYRRQAMCVILGG